MKMGDCRVFCYPPEKVGAKTLWNQQAQEGPDFRGRVKKAPAA
jgi:hypothetical protein